VTGDEPEGPAGELAGDETEGPTEEDSLLLWLTEADGTEVDSAEV